MCKKINLFVPVGETFEVTIKGKKTKLKVVESESHLCTGCLGCIAEESDRLPLCSKEFREDNKEVIFIKAE